MKIFIGADHRGVVLKERIKELIVGLGHTVTDVGTASERPCDYPAIAYRVARAVAAHRNSRGILLCMSGIGVSIVANKVPGAYAALCYNKEVALLSRQHNNANIMVLGSKFVSPEEMAEMIPAWLAEGFEGGRHERRVRQIKRIEQQLRQREG